MGHHQDDQAETVLMRLLRGAGPIGLSAIPEKRTCGRGLLLRPLLQTPRSVIEAFAEQECLSPVNDNSNSDLSYDRNYLRHQVLPLLSERWPNYRDSFSRVAARQREVSQVIEARELPTTQSALGVPGVRLRAREPRVLAQELYLWMKRQSLSTFTEERLLEFARQCLSAKPDRMPAIRDTDLELIRWRDVIYLNQSSLCHEQLPATICVGEPLRGDWGEIEWTPAAEGLKEGARCQLSYRSEGQELAPLGRPSRSLSQWLKEGNIPPFRRDDIPLLSYNGSVVAVCNLGLTADASDHLAVGQDGFLPRWRPPFKAQ